MRANRMIRAREVRVIGPEGEHLGILPMEEALAMATAQGLDLVEVSPDAEPPVCKIIDYGKFRYQQDKRSREAKKRQRVIHIKEVRMRPKTEENDYQVKSRQIRRFLEEGNKAKVSMRFRGREYEHVQLGQQKLERLIQEMQDVATVEQPPHMEGRIITLVLAPKH
ncbi:MAG TPA: translation initiation factor IF-3 [Alphaproteobacteria bacterium]|nr:translation initiation factor IF-3 [Alphaproteobacteria bacterium]